MNVYKVNLTEAQRRRITDLLDADSQCDAIIGENPDVEYATVFYETCLALRYNVEESKQGLRDLAALKAGGIE